MKSPTLAIAALSLAAAFGLAGCYGNNNYCDVYNCNADPSGVYEGNAVDSATNISTPVVAIIDENGNGALSGQDGSYYDMSLTTSGNSLGGSFNAFSSGSSTMTPGPISGSLTNAGLQVVFTFSGPGGHTVTANLSFDPVYNQSSSLSALQGNWNTVATSYNGIGCASGTPNCPPSGSATLSLSITNAGSFTGTDSNNCTYSGGQFTTVDVTLNAYEMSFTRTCGSGPTLNFSNGIATYFPATGSGSNATPAQLLFLADDGAGNYVAQLLQ